MQSKKAADYDERVDLDEDTDPEDPSEDEEVEYEEVEEEVEEIEEEVEEEEEMEEEVEEEVEEEEGEGNHADRANSDKCTSSDEAKLEDKNMEKKHADLLALPPHGSEVYLGSIPNNANEEELRAFCESAGEVVEVRIMKRKDSSENKGFAFVTFRSQDLASKAIGKLNNSEFKGKKIKCSLSQAKNRLFIGNVPKTWGDEDLEKVVKEIGPGVIAIKLVKDMNNSGNNRGFAFIDYYNHACAEFSKERMTNPKFKLENNAPTVSWAEGKNADSSPASQVKAVYVKNLPKSITQDQLKKLFEHHGNIIKVVIPPAKSGQEKNRIGFVHFSQRSSAMSAVEDNEKYELDGQVLECSLAKPQADQKVVKPSNSSKPGLLSSYSSHVGYGLAAPAYGALGASYGASDFVQPVMFGRGPTAGTPMMPMLLPDGRIGYVLQQPGGQAHTLPSQQRHSNRSGSKISGSSSRGRYSNSGGSGHRYHPY